MQEPFLQCSLTTPKGEVANGEDGQHPLAAELSTRELSRRIKFYAENTACRLFRPE